MSLKHRISFCIGHYGTIRGVVNGVDPARLTRHSPFDFFSRGGGTQWKGGYGDVRPR